MLGSKLFDIPSYVYHVFSELPTIIFCRRKLLMATCTSRLFKSDSKVRKRPHLVGACVRACANGGDSDQHLALLNNAVA